MPWSVKLAIRRRKSTVAKPSVPRLYDDVWHLVLDELRLISLASVRALRLVNRNLHFLATPYAFRNLTICTGAAMARTTDDCLQYLISDAGEPLRRYVREIDITDSYYGTLQFDNVLILELIRKLVRLDALRWRKAMFMPPSLAHVVEDKWPSARVCIEHTCIEGRALDLPAPQSITVWHTLHSLKLRLEDECDLNLIWFDRVLSLLGAFDSLRVIDVGVDDLDREEPSSWWAALAPALVWSAPVGRLRELVLDGMFMEGHLDGPPPFAMQYINWRELTRLELTYPPTLLLNHLAREMVSLKVFRCGPLFGQWNPGHELAWLWSGPLETFVARCPRLEELGITADRHVPIPTIAVHGRRLKSLRLHALERCECGNPKAHPYPVEMLESIQAACPEIEALALDLDSTGHIGPRELHMLGRFKKLRSLEIIKVRCRGEKAPSKEFAPDSEALFRALRRSQGEFARLESLVVRAGAWPAWPGFLRAAHDGRTDELHVHVHLDDRGRVQRYERSERRQRESAREYWQILRHEEERRQERARWRLEMEHEREKEERKERRQHRKEARKARRQQRKQERKARRQQRKGERQLQREDERKEARRQELNRAWKDGEIVPPPSAAD